MPSTYFDFLDPACIPEGLSEQMYAACCRALREMNDSHTLSDLENRYQFCCGFMYALQEAQLVPAQVYLPLEAKMNKIWIERVTAIQSQAQ